MPKVFLSEQARRNNALVEYINDHVGRGRMFRWDADLAEAIGMHPKTFTRRRKDPSAFSFGEFCRLLEETRASDREVARILGVEYRGRAAS